MKDQILTMPSSSSLLNGFQGQNPGVQFSRTQDEGEEAGEEDFPEIMIGESSGQTNPDSLESRQFLVILDCCMFYSNDKVHV